MKRVLRALPWLLFITSVVAQSQCLSLTSQFPACVAGCITTGASKIGCTNTRDLSCQCSSDSSAAIQAYAAECATAACKGDAAAILDGLEAGTSVCNCVTSAASEALQLIPVTDSYEASSTAKPQFGCSEGSVGGNPSQPPYSNTWSPASSSTRDSYTYETADAVTPIKSYEEDEEVGCCEKTKVVTVIRTTTSVSSWTPPVWSSPHSSSSRSSFPHNPVSHSSSHSYSSWTFSDAVFETEEGSPPYETQVPFEDDTENKAIAEEAAGACFGTQLSKFSSCAAVCYENTVGYAGCASYDYQCHCERSSESDIHFVLDTCIADCEGSDNTIRAEEFFSQVCDCLPTSDLENDDHFSKRREPHDKIILAQHAPQAPERDNEASRPRDVTPARARDVAPALENCTSLAEKVMPTCAQECYLSMASDVGCGQLDFPCQCKEDVQAKLTTMMMPCVLTACDFAELPSVMAGGSSVCSCASAPGKGQARLEDQTETGAPAPTAAPEQAAPGSEPAEMGAPLTTCHVVTVPTNDCAVHRPTFAPCGRDCLSPVVPEAGCEIDDFSCQCHPDSQAALSTLVHPCVQESCQDPSAVPIKWDPSAMCACASSGRTSTTCYDTTVAAPTTPRPTSSSWPTSSGTSTTATSDRGAADRYGVGIIVGIVTAVFVAAIAL